MMLNSPEDRLVMKYALITIEPVEEGDEATISQPSSWQDACDNVIALGENDPHPEDGVDLEKLQAYAEIHRERIS